GVTALITILSVMNGFELELRSRILSMTSHATVTGGGAELTDWRAVVKQAEQHPEVLGAAPYVEAVGMLSNAGRLSGASIRGILPSEEAKVADIGSKMVRGSLDDLEGGEWNIVLGRYLAYSLGVQV